MNLSKNDILHGFKNRSYDKRWSKGAYYTMNRVKYNPLIKLVNNKPKTIRRKKIMPVKVIEL